MFAKRSSDVEGYGMGYKDTEYIYASARVRALEAKLLTPERYLQLIEAPGTAEAVALLADALPIRYDADGNFDLEATADEFLQEAFALVRAITPNPAAFDLFSYEFDANNVKAAIKAFYRDIPADDMLFGCGTVPKEKVVAAVRERDFSAFPKHIAAAAKQAMEEYAATGDPQGIDLTVDAAAFADRKDAAGEDAFLTETVANKADAVNTLTYLRLLERGIPSQLDRAFLPGGRLTKETLTAAADRDALCAVLKNAAPLLGAALDRDRTASLGAIEKAFDDALLAEMKQVKWQPFGLSVVCAYLYAVLAEVKNLRILFSLRAVGASGEEIRKHLRTV